MPVFTHGHALIIGAGGNLPNTLTDAERLAELLQDTERCAYPQDQVHLLVGEQADRQNILDGLEGLAKTCQPGSTVIVYFSGHGYKVAHPALGTQFYLMPNGYLLSALPKTAIRGSEFAGKLAAIPAQKLLLIFDCCHAGGVAAENPAGGQATEAGPGALAKSPGLEFTKAPLPQEALELLQAGRGRALLASSRADELSFAGKPLSAFTLALVEALCGQGAAQADGFVRLADLALHTREKVPFRTGDRQHPILDFVDADNFAVAYYAAGASQPKGLPFPEPPQIEPEPGAWTISGNLVHTGDIHAESGATVNVAGGDVISTGGAPYIKNANNNTFIQGDQVNIQDRRVSGTFTNSVINTGDHSQINVSIAQDNFLERLAELQTQLARSSLPAEQKNELQADLDVVSQEAVKEKPNSQRLLSRLAGTVEFLANSATIAASAPQAIELGRQILETARTLFH
jgi:hypothetical protein